MQNISSEHISLFKTHANSDSSLMGMSKVEKTLLAMIELDYIDVSTMTLTDAGLKYMIRKYQSTPLDFTKGLGFAGNPENIGKVTRLAVDNMKSRPDEAAQGIESMTTELNYQFDGMPKEDRVLQMFEHYFGPRGKKAEDDIEV